jgi:hypothetical protein
MGRLKLFGEPEGDGTNDHSALSNLGYAQSGHTGFVPSQGEALIEILRLTQNIIRDSEGTNRLTFAPTSPHITLTGDAKVTGTGLFGPSPVAVGEAHLRTGGDLTGYPAVGLHCLVTGARPSGTQLTAGVYGGAIGAGTPTASFVYGLFFQATHATPSPCGGVVGVYVQPVSAAAGTGVVTQSVGVFLDAAAWGGSKPATAKGVYVGQQGGAGVATAYGLQIVDQTATTVRLLELGPATPYLRLLGGGDPPADKSNLYLKFGSTLYRVVKTGTSMTLEAA